MKKEVYSEIKPIFSTPIFLSVTDKQFSKKEISFLKSKHTSNNILNNKILKDIKKEIVIAIHNYFAAIDQPSNDLNFDIFQSWVEKGIKSKKNLHIYQVKQKHSYLTGFLYIEANEKRGSEWDGQFGFHSPSHIDERHPNKYRGGITNVDKWEDKDNFKWP